MEVWKQITDKYEVSDLGEVRNAKTKRVLKTWMANGYKYVSLPSAETQTYNRKNTHYSVARLVLSAFVSVENSNTVVNHIDGNRLNNNLTNLEWCTQKENLYHSRNITKHGRVISYQKIKHLYDNNKNLKLNEFVDLILNNCK